jgi:putative colanic acid biosysnthesis UDP-glucose lipid carrier transferase
LAAVIGSVTGRDSQRRVRFGSVEPAILVILGQLDPLICVLSLVVCTLAYGGKLTPAIGGVAALTFITASRVFRARILEGDTGASLSTVFARILFGWMCVVGVLLFTAFAFKVGAVFSRMVMLTWFVVTPLCLEAAHVLRARTQWLITHSGRAPRYLIIGANSVGFELFRRLPKSGFLGFFDFRSPDRVAQVIDPAQFAGHCKDVAEFARTHGVTSIYIALPLSNVPRIGEMVRELRDTTASIYFVPDVFAFDLIQGRLVEINGMPALSVCDTPFHGTDAVLKRVTDIAIGALALIALSPLMLLVALAVKITSAGPVLFRQRRYGLNGEEILVYKFRTMTVCEDGAVVRQAAKDDQRVTWLGRVLRRTSIDELPQLLNVLQGKMSLVGPRPHAIAHNELYRKLISGYMIRHKVRPGITGLAQVNGLRGETETVEKMSERVRFDLEYLRNWTPWLDLKIILKTVWVIVVAKDRNAY